MTSPVWPLPICSDSWAKCSRFLCSMLFTSLDFTSITSHIHNGVLFLLWLHLFILSGVLSALISSSIWESTSLGGSSFSVLSFCLFILFVGFSRQEYWNGFPFPSPGDHILSELSTVTHPSRLALRLRWAYMAYSFIELEKAVVHVIRLVSFLWLWFSFCLPSDGEGLESYDSFLRGETEGETGSGSDGWGRAQ